MLTSANLTSLGLKIEYATSSDATSNFSGWAEIPSADTTTVGSSVGSRIKFLIAKRTALA